MYVFGDLLRQFRVRAGLTQQQLANELGVSRNALNNWERLKSLPRLNKELVIELGRILVLDQDDLNQLLLALGYALEPVEPPVQATVMRYKAIETEYLKVTQQLDLAPGVLLSQQKRRADCYQQISLPVNYIERTEILAIVRAKVLAQSTPEVLASAVKGKPAALHGMGGIGKTVIARALCDDPDVQAAFPDGILWARLGQTPNLLEQLRLWVSTLGGKITEHVSTVESLKRTLGHLLKDRTCLLILDDVWQHSHAHAFRVEAPNCRFLLTTRDAEIARELGAKVQPIPVMTPGDAVTLLEEWAAGNLAETAAALKEQIVKRLGYLLLAVKLAGAQLQRKAPHDWLHAFDVRKLKSSRPEDLHDSLEQTFLLSLDTLGLLQRQLYLTLAIFKEDEATLQVAIEKLWQGQAELGANACTELLEDLEARALLDLVPHGSSRAVLMHDLMRDLIITELGEDGRFTAQQALLGAYHATCTGVGWHTAPEDGYLYDHLAYHLHASRSLEELEGLFVSQDWLHVRVLQGNDTYDGYLADLALAWETAFVHAQQQVESNQEPTAITACIRYVLIRTSINSIAENSIPELVAQAVSTGLWTPQRALSIAAKIPDAAKQAKLCLLLLESRSLTSVQEAQAQQLGLEALLAWVPWNVDDRSNMLAQLLPLLPDELRQHALQATLAVPYLLERAEILADLAPHLQEEERSQAISQAWKDALALPLREKVRVLSRLAALLSESVYQQAIDQTWNEVLAVAEERERSKALTALTSILPKKFLQPTLETTFALKDEESRAGVLAALALHFPQQVLRQVLASLREFSAVGQAKLLAALAPLLPEELVPQVLEQALKLFEYGRAEILIALAPSLPEDLLPTVLKPSLTIRDVRARVRVLLALIPRLQGVLLTQAVEGLRETLSHSSDAELRAQALAQLTTLVSADEFLQPALATVLEIAEKDKKAEILAQLASHLTGEHLQRALDAALLMDDVWEQTKMLNDVIPLLPERVLPQVLEMALTAGHARAQIELLRTLVPRLPGELPGRTLNRILELAEWEWPTALIVFAPLFRGQEPQRALEIALTLPVHQQAQALIALGPLLPQLQLQKAVASLEAFPDWERAEVLCALAPLAPDELLKPALEAALALPEWQSAKVLSEFAPHLSGAFLEHLLEVAPKFSEWWQWEVLKALVFSLGEHQLRQIVERTLAFEVEEWRGLLLAALAPRVPKNLAKRVLESTYTLNDERIRVEVLAPLSAVLAGEEYNWAVEEAWRSALAIADERTQAMLLTTVAVLLPEQLLQSGLEAVLALPGSGRPKILASLAPRLPEELLRRALETVLNAEERESAKLLACLVPSLSENLLQEALRLVLLYPDQKQVMHLLPLLPRLPVSQVKQVIEIVLILLEQNWTSVVASITPWLAEESLKPILQKTLALQNPWERAHALAILVPNLTGEDCNRALIEALKAAIELPWFAGDSVISRIAPKVTAPLLLPILKVIDSCQDSMERAIVLAMLFPYISDQALLLKRIRQEMLEALSSFQNKTRIDMLRWYLVRTIITTPLLSSETIGSVASHMLEICQAWHWL